MNRRRRITVAAPSVGPLGVAGCVLWLRADLGVTKDGSDKVSQWDDQSGNGHSVGQATPANKPLWVAAAANGKPGIYFDTPGGNKFLLSDAFSRTGAETLFVVGSVDTIGGVHHTFCDGLSVNTRRLYENNPALTAYAGANVADGSMISGEAGVLRAVFDTTGNVALNGAETAGNTGITAGSGITIGAAGGGGSSPLEGYIHEVVLFATELSAAEVSRVEDYLTARYGVA